MKLQILILFFPLFSFGQYKPNEKIPLVARVVSDSGIIKGYFVAGADSSVIISSTKRYSDGSAINIPVNSIKELRLRHKTGNSILVAHAAFVVGFILTAGLTKNAGDVNNDGKTSFWELLFTAIDGTTSSNRRRRNTALIVGAAGGTTAMVVELLSLKKLSLVFPIRDRNKFYNEKRAKLNDYIKF